MDPFEPHVSKLGSRLGAWLAAGVSRSLDPSVRRKVAIANVASLAAFVAVAVLSFFYALSPHPALHHGLALQLPLLPIYVAVPWLHARDRATAARRLLLGATAIAIALGVHFVFGVALKSHVVFAVIAVAALVLYPDEQTLERNVLVAALVAAFAYSGLARPPPSAELAEVPAEVVRLLSVLVPATGFVVMWLIILVTEHHAEDNETRLERASTRDALTGLANRRALGAELEQAVRHARRYGDGVAVLYLDLDGFKAINDVQGHAAGDRVLGEVARRLTSLLGPADVAARVGGDEFCVLLPRVEGDTEREAVRLAEQVVRALSEPHDLNGSEGEGAPAVSSGSSVGVAVLGPNESAEAMLSRADEAMYAAKAAGKGRVVLAPAAAP